MISLESITKEYKNGSEITRVLKGIDLEVKEGEFIAIMGPSGSGKSTLMNIIGMLDDQTSGEYKIDGVFVNELKDSEKTKIRGDKIGFVFQNYSLIPRIKALKQVMIPLAYAGIEGKIAQKNAKEALSRVGLEDKFESKPDELSGGQKQRVAIARAICVNPSIILADEPTGALDSQTGEEVMELFRSLNNEGKTIILITHENDIAQKADRIITVKDGLLT